MVIMHSDELDQEADVLSISILSIACALMGRRIKGHGFDPFSALRL